MASGDNNENSEQVLSENSVSENPVEDGQILGQEDSENMQKADTNTAQISENHARETRVHTESLEMKGPEAAKGEKAILADSQNPAEVQLENMPKSEIQAAQTTETATPDTGVQTESNTGTGPKAATSEGANSSAIKHSSQVISSKENEQALSKIKGTEEQTGAVQSAAAVPAEDGIDSRNVETASAVSVQEPENTVSEKREVDGDQECPLEYGAETVIARAEEPAGGSSEENKTQGGEVVAGMPDLGEKNSGQDYLDAASGTVLDVKEPDSQAQDALGSEGAAADVAHDEEAFAPHSQAAGVSEKAGTPTNEGSAQLLRATEHISAEDTAPTTAGVGPEPPRLSDEAPSPKAAARPTGGSSLSTGAAQALPKKPLTAPSKAPPQIRFRRKTAAEIAAEGAMGALHERSTCAQLDAEYHAKIEKGRQRRRSRLPEPRPTMTTPKSLAYSKEELVRSSAPRWKHTWSYSDPREVYEAQKQLEAANAACQRQDVEIFNHELFDKRREQLSRRQREESLQKFMTTQTVMASTEGQSKLAKVYSQRSQEQMQRAMKLIESERRNYDYRSRVEKQRLEEQQRKAEEREGRIVAARQRMEHATTRSHQYKLEMAIQSEFKRRALRGKIGPTKQFEAKLQHNEARTQHMKRRIQACEEQHAEYCALKHNEILRNLQSSSENRSLLLQLKSEQTRSKREQRLHEQEIRLKEISKANSEYCFSKMEKMIHREVMHEAMKTEKHRAYREWLDTQRAKIYDDFMRREVLVDSLNWKKMRKRFASMWLESYPIQECRPATRG